MGLRGFESICSPFNCSGTLGDCLLHRPCAPHALYSRILIRRTCNLQPISPLRSSLFLLPLFPIHEILRLHLHRLRSRPSCYSRNNRREASALNLTHRRSQSFCYRNHREDKTLHLYEPNHHGRLHRPNPSSHDRPRHGHSCKERRLRSTHLGHHPSNLV